MKDLVFIYFLRRVCVIAALAALAACSTSQKPSAPNPHYKIGAPYKIKGEWYTPAENPAYDEVGIASWYGKQFHGRATANGEIFDKARLSAAHKTLPLPSLVHVDNLENGRSITLRVNDRGPFADDRIIDLSQSAARALGFEEKGLARVRVRYAGEAVLTAEAPKPGRKNKVRQAAVTSSAPKPQPVLTLPQPTPQEQDPIAALVARTVAPQPVSAKGPDRQPNLAPVSGLWVRVGTFFDRNAVQAAQLNLSDIGPSQIDTAADAIGDVHTLFFGPYNDETIAMAWVAAAVDAGYPDAQLVSRAY